MRVIFTDIDGVLNPHWRKKWKKSSISLFNKICIEFNLHPVITSSWRVSHSKEDLQNIFTEQGINVIIHDYTPVIPQSARGIEIKTWLDNNICEDWVVIDDVVWNIEPYVKNVVKCRSWEGLTSEEYNIIKDILK